MEVDDNTHLWGEQYNRKLADALALQNEIAAQISDRLRLKLSSDQKARLAKGQTENPDAYRLYLQGRFYADKLTKEGLEKGLDYFRQAIALDPNYARAYAGTSAVIALADDVGGAPRDIMPKGKRPRSRRWNWMTHWPRGTSNSALCTSLMTMTGPPRGANFGAASN